MRNPAFLVLGVALTVGALSGCATTAAEAERTPSTVAEGFLCGGLSITREALEARVPLGEISEPGRIALESAVWDDGSPIGLQPEDGWYLATLTESLVGVMRDLDVVDDPASGTIAPDHEVQTVARMDNATNLEPGWYAASHSRCAVTVDLGDLTVPAVALQSPPDVTSPDVRLLVTEQSCNSGEDALGRIEVVSIVETDDLVSLVLGVRPRGGDQNCPSNPATPFTVTLSEPLGDRELRDASLAEPRVLTAAP